MILIIILFFISCCLVLIGVSNSDRRPISIGIIILIIICIFFAIICRISESNKIIDYLHPKDIIDVSLKSNVTYNNFTIHYDDKYGYAKEIPLDFDDQFSISYKNVDSPRIIQYPVKLKSSFYKFFLGDPVEYLYEVTLPEP